MSRPVDPKAQYQVKAHKTKGYMYASTQPSYIDPQTGKKKYRYIHWGILENDCKFIPNSTYRAATAEEKESLIFPDGWDLSEVKRLQELFTFAEYHNRLYGDIWLLEQVASKTGIRQDLEVVFAGNINIVDDIMTLAMFPYLTRFNYNRVARWQRLAKTPSTKELTSTEITRLTQSITEQHRMDLLKLRAKRLEKGELCAVDSTTRSAYGYSLSDIRWGKNKENLPLAQTLETVVYTVSSHMPVYYRTFPGNMPDSRSLDVILADLEYAGFRDIVLITDRGYETIHNLEKYILRGQSMIMCAKVSQKDAAKAIRQLGEFGTRPAEMMIDPETKIYYSQYDIAYSSKSINQSNTNTQLKLNLYFDPIRRSHELMEMDICLTLQQTALRELLKNNAVLDGDAILKRDFCYCNVTYDPATRVITGFKLNEKKISKAQGSSGFFSIITNGIDYDAVKTFKTYGLRDEQEKCFQQMKDQMGSDRQRNWSEEGKTGRLFILFVSLILSSYVRNIWKSTKLRDLFSSSLDILDEMRSIRYVEHLNDAKTVITPFVGDQVSICEVFGFDIPKGCKPLYTSRYTHTRKKGHPPKQDDPSF